MNSSSRSSTFNFSEPALGLIAALGAFLTWGALPLYFHLIDRAVSPWEILAHRILWTAALLGIVVVLWRRTDRLWRVFTAPRLLGTLALTAALVATNWGTFIWAVVNDHVIEASLGYYINPLLNVALGFVFLGERLRRLQWIAVAIAATGVVFSVVAYGQVPWIGLILAGCFGFYGLIRKRLDVDSVTGLLVETLLLSPIALAWLIRLYAAGGAAFGIAGPQTDALLIGAGVLTIVPFTLFAAGARRLRLGTIGIIQYLTPTLHFLTGVLVLHEPLTAADEVTFACIWLALAIYTIDIVASQWGTRRAARAA
ncbi:EamA family transporter RarD [Salinisphaera hydrothermalis]|uniref:EamA family transporter RarD n=1 Tax=Salinisphaera hydrothermalis TaxID=563188 RepID=UPI0033425C82